MPTVNTRFTLSIPNDMVKRAEAIKKDAYFDKPYAEMYRQLIQLGMDTLEGKSTLENDHETGQVKTA